MHIVYREISISNPKKLPPPAIGSSKNLEL